MRLGLMLGYWGLGLTAEDQRALLLEAENAGFDSVWTAEAYGSDGVEARALGLEQQRALVLGRQAEPPVAQHQAEAHANLLSRVVRVAKGGASYGQHR